MKTIHLKITDSTNEYAKEIAKTEKEDVLITADSQTAGKGRLGRSFVSYSKGLYMSLLLHPKINAKDSLKITVMAAVAVARAIEKVCNIKTEIKWVNDIYLNGKKVCGILTEGAVNPQTKMLDYAVLGIGLNVFEPDGGFCEEIKEIAAALYKEEIPFVKERLCDCICSEFLKLYNGEDGTYENEYKSRSLVLGKRIEYVKDGQRFSGKAVDISDDGNLIIIQNGKTVSLNSGEVKIDIKSLKK